MAVRGQVPALLETIAGLQLGLLISLAAIFLLLAASFQSFRMSLAVAAVIPAALSGTLLSLWLTGTTLNAQSFIGSIMAAGIAVANAILLVTFAESSLEQGASPLDAALEGGQSRLRAILMTAMAMIAGMIPMALGIGEGAEQTAPLGRAVIGGLALATFATLSVLPAFYAVLRGKSAARSPSLDPDDHRSRYHEPK